MTEPGSDHDMFSPGNDAGIDPAYTDEQLVRDALLLLRKFALMPSQWPDGPKAFPGAVERALNAHDRIVADARRTRFQANNMIVVPEDRALRAEAERDALLRWADQAAASLRYIEANARDAQTRIEAVGVLISLDAVTGGHQ